MSGKTKLKHSLLQLLKRDHIGSHATRHDRRQILLKFAEDVNKLGYKFPDIYQLKLKHIQAVIKDWQSQHLSNATIKNRVSCIRHLSELIGKPQLVPANNVLNIAPRKYVSEHNRALFNPDFSRVNNEHIKMSLELQRLFGLRREESLKIKPHLADKGDYLLLNPSWCKGGRGRVVPIRNDEQRQCLEQAKVIAGKFGNSLIPEDKNYIKQRQIYDKQTWRADLRNLHGLRHAYAQTRYKEITGWEAPVNGGPKLSQMTSEMREKDHQARMIITEELGHSRKNIVKNYLK